ncbi:kinase-like domain-containing protein [Mariannaea sp. PMI_226]|nr:kinase-like domain-containing protein [Mariannaea sp. PMI_226]
MLKDEEKYWTPSGAITPGGPSIWHVIVNDQRRLVSVKMDEEQESEDTAVPLLKRHMDKIPSDAVQVHFSSEGELISTSTDPRDDDTHCIYYPPVHEIKVEGIQTILRSDLEELDRLGPDVDLVIYPPSSRRDGKKVIFKYYYLFQFINWIWDEMNILMRLPRHPNLVPFDKVVLDELTGRVVGFTINYITGGTLEENISRTFKLKYLNQLFGVVDDLNLKHGLSHQDIAPRNLLIDEETDSILLFDFNYSARIGMRQSRKDPFKTRPYIEERNDIKGVWFTIYEIITQDASFSSLPHQEQEISVLERKEWQKHPTVTLDRPVSEFRSALREWDKRRRLGKQLKVFTEAPWYIDWPFMADPPPTVFKSHNLDGSENTYTMVTYIQRRALEQKKGNPVIDWQRPPADELMRGTRVLATGRIIHEIK